MKDWIEPERFPRSEYQKERDMYAKMKEEALRARSAKARRDLINARRAVFRWLRGRFVRLSKAQGDLNSGGAKH